MTTPALALIYTCNLCQKNLSPAGPPIIGEKPEERLQKLGQALVAHLVKEHSPHVIQMGLAGKQYSGWLFIEQFTHNDTELAKESNKTRLHMRALTKRVQIPDETIEKQVDTHLPDDPRRDKIIGLLKGMRDSLDEVPALDPTRKG